MATPWVASADGKMKARMNFTPAVPKDDAEKAIIEKGTKAGMFMTRDENGELNGRRNYPPTWTAERAWQRTHKGKGLA